MKLNPITGLCGTVVTPGDKSISHRAVMFGSIAKGKTTIRGFLKGQDCLSTISCFQMLGIPVRQTSVKEGDRDIPLIKVEGRGLYGLHQSSIPLNTGNSGTTTRLMSGILCGQPFSSVLYGDDSLNSRPMGRIITPLTGMGADITSTSGNGCAPLLIRPAELTGIHYDSPVASAQVKSCVILAAMYARGETTVTEPVLSRDHTERMLTAFGAKLDPGKATSLDGRSFCSVTVTPGRELYGCDIYVPGDISSAAYWIAAGLIVPGSSIVIQNTGINPTRSGILEVCRMMGAQIEVRNVREQGGEPVADLHVQTSALHGTVIEGDLIPSLIDEIPVIAVMAAAAAGDTIIRDAAELRVKETDRIDTICSNLKQMGCDVTPTEDGMIIRGGRPLHGAVIDPKMDHRIAMAFSIAALIADSDTTILHEECIHVSYPSFFSTLKTLIR